MNTNTNKFHEKFVSFIDNNAIKKDRFGRMYTINNPKCIELEKTIEKLNKEKYMNLNYEFSKGIFFCEAKINNK